MDNIDDLILQLADDDPSKKQDGSSGSRGAAGSSQKTEKRYFSESEDDDESESDLDFSAMDEHCYKGEDDMRRLQAMPEVQREQILARRADKRQRYREKMELQEMLYNKKDDSTRRSARAKGSGTSSALGELTRRRAEKHQGQSHRAEKAKRRRTSYSDQSDYEYSAEEGYGSEEVERDETKKKEPTLDQIRSICLTRDMIVAWQHKPFFDRVASGSFVRLLLDGRGTERKYRLCEVMHTVQRESVYELTDKLGSKTSLLLKHGEAKREFKMNIISNSPVQQDEYERLLKTMAAERCRPLTVKKVEDKLADFKHAHEYVLNEAEYAEMIKKNKAAGNARINTARDEAIRRALGEESAMPETQHEYHRTWDEPTSFGQSHTPHKDTSRPDQDETNALLRTALAALQQKLNEPQGEVAGQSADVSYVDLVRNVAREITLELHL